MIGVLNLAIGFNQWQTTTSPASVDQQQQQPIETRDQDPTPISLESVMAEFHLSNVTLKRFMAQMTDDMNRGLEGGLAKSTIAMLPSFVPELPNGTEYGKFIAMDLGGTNLRIMLAQFAPDQPMTTKQFNSRIPNWALHGTGEQCLVEFLEEHNVADEGLSVGFTFSYPCTQTSLRSAKLLRWTKGFDASGVVGMDVVEMLEMAIARHSARIGKLVDVKIVALINDTVGTMVAAAHQTGGVCHLGVIIATGTNASYMERVENIKYGLADAAVPYPYKHMIIDTEWGGFGDNNEADYIMTQYDKTIDAQSEHPGVNIFDKLVAGATMGELVRVVLEKLNNAHILFNGLGSEHLFTPGSFPTKYISEILRDDGGSYINTRQILGELGIDEYNFNDMLILREVCTVVSRRSANLAAAAIACVLNRVREKKMVIGIDGSTYKYHPFYNFYVCEKLRDLVDQGLEYQVLQTADGSGKGAALVAAIASRLASS